MTTLRDLVTAIQTRLGDHDAVIWTADEIVVHVQAAYTGLATQLRLFWDWTYAENLPRGFSITATWERPFLAGVGRFTYGLANFTFEDERRLLGDERLRSGPANHTSPFEATDGFLSRAGASVDIPATAELPATVMSLARCTWDAQTLDALSARHMAAADSRYEVTKGEVYGFIWGKDGVRTLRKVRVPSAVASTVVVTGAWGALRQLTDLTTDAIGNTFDGAFDAETFDANAFDGDGVAWGTARRIPGQHPIGMTQAFGLPRRIFLEGTNVRVEHHRVGRPLVRGTDVCELPDRYAQYLRDYVQARLLERAGPGQDLKLAAHFQARWVRHLARIADRLERVDAQRVPVLGGDGQSLTSRPPRPSRPWPYGSQVR